MCYLRGLVSGNGLSQQSIRRRSDTGKACEFQLQEYPGVLPSGRFARRWMGAEEAARNQPHFPAARGVLEAGKAVERLFIEQRINHPAVQVPLSANRPGPGGFD